MSNFENITPTMHYTSYVWVKNGLSKDIFSTSNGKLYYNLVRPFDFLLKITSDESSLESNLLRRHKTINHLLDKAINNGYEQIIEIACGLTGRGLQTATDNPNITYIESDLEHVVSLKSKIINQNKLKQDNHHILLVDILKDEGKNSLNGLIGTHLDKTKKTLIIVEGLLSYFNEENIDKMISNIKSFLESFPEGQFLFDYNFKNSNMSKPSKARKVLEYFVKNKLTKPYQDFSQLNSYFNNKGYALTESFYDCEICKDTKNKWVIIKALCKKGIDNDN